MGGRADVDRAVAAARAAFDDRKGLRQAGEAGEDELHEELVAQARSQVGGVEPFAEDVQARLRALR